LIKGIFGIPLKIDKLPWIDWLHWKIDFLISGPRFYLHIELLQALVWVFLGLIPVVFIFLWLLQMLRKTPYY